MSGELIRRTNDLSVIRNVARSSEADRKLYAAKAVAARDHENLWILTKALLDLEGAGKHTIRSYRRGVHDLLEAWEGVDLLRATPTQAQLYVRELFDVDREKRDGDPHAGEPALAENGRMIETKPLGAATVRSRVSAAAALYRALRWAGVTTSDPFADVKVKKPERTAREHAKAKAYTQEEYDALEYVALSTEGGVNLELLLILRLGGHAGLRASEMLNLRWADVDISEGRLLVRGGKGGKTAFVKMSGSLKAALTSARQQNQVAARDTVLGVKTQSSIYRALEKAWHQACAYRVSLGQLASGDEPAFKGIHGLRHYTGTRFANEVKDLRKVRDHLRHTSVTTTEMYAGLAEEMSELDDW